MMSFINRILDLIKWPWFEATSVAEVNCGIERALIAQAASAPTEVMPTKKRAKLDENVSDDEAMGIWRSNRGLFENLEEYLKIAARLKKASPDQYKAFQRYGAHLMPPDVAFNKKPYTLKGLPSFGAIATIWDRDDDEERRVVPVKFVSFIRLKKSPPNVEMAAGPVYEVFVFLADKKKQLTAGKMRRLQAADTFHIEIDEAANSFRVLKHLFKDTKTVRRKTKKTVGGKRQSIPSDGESVFSISTMKWDYPTILQYGVDDDNEEVKVDPQDKGRGIFGWFMSGYMQMQAGLRMRAQKNGVSTVFSIDMLRTPNIFNDREKTVTVKGKTKKIFHIVRTHIRKLSDGTIQPVRSHFRGERKFMWNGFNIEITMPGLHHWAVGVDDYGLEGEPFADSDEMKKEGMVEFAEMMSMTTEALYRKGSAHAK
jgi:hypothetical protein